MGMRRLEPSHIEYAFASVNSAYRMIGEKLKAGVKDETIEALFMVLGLALDGLQVTLEIVPHRIERLHQKIDRIEKKIGSV